MNDKIGSSYNVKDLEVVSHVWSQSHIEYLEEEAFHQEAHYVKYHWDHNGGKKP